MVEIGNHLKQFPKEYYEEPLPVDFDEFSKVVESRRSVRKFTDEPIPDDVVHACLDLALLSPTSSNLQSWEFYRVVDPQKKEKLKEACLDQPAATTAPELIVAVARTDTWKEHSAAMLDLFETSAWSWPKTMQQYYKYVTPVAYGQGLVGELGPVKRFVSTITGLVRPVPRGPAGNAELTTWAVKTTALACQTLMLAFRAAGYDTCPMEGMDEVRVRKLLDLPRSATIVMVISAGKRAKGGVYGPRLRLERERFIHTV